MTRLDRDVVDEVLPEHSHTSHTIPLAIQRLPPAAYFEQHGGVVLTFGIFDGVHRGHQAILRRICERAEVLQAPSVAIIFRPRPKEMVQAIPRKPYETTEQETCRLIRQVGVQHVGVLRFTRELAVSSSRQFLPRLIVRVPVRELWLGAGALVGNGPEGELPAVQKIGASLGFTVEIFEQQ